MSIGVKIVLILFSLIMLFFTVYQFLLGNPFGDDVSPGITLLLFFVLSLFTLFTLFQKKREK